jgi:hypothetical protein
VNTRVSATAVLDEDMDFAPAVLDPAHIGDIEGALGTVPMRDRVPRRGVWRKLKTFAAIMGPGLIVMVGDNDAGGCRHTLKLARPTATACCGSCCCCSRCSLSPRRWWHAWAPSPASATPA